MREYQSSATPPTKKGAKEGKRENEQEKVMEKMGRAGKEDKRRLEAIRWFKSWRLWNNRTGFWGTFLGAKSGMMQKNANLQKNANFRSFCVLRIPPQTRILKRRYYLVEKAKDANIVGILVGTLGVAGYLHMVNQMKELIYKAGKKSYTLVMGRPNSAKLANFPECDVFVFVSCAQTALLDSKDFLAPVITPFEAVLSFSRGRQWTGEYVMDFRELINSAVPEPEAVNGAEEARFSFLQGGYVEDISPQENGKRQKESSLDLVEATEKALSLKNQSVDSILFKGTATTGAEFLAARSYQGLNGEYENPSVPSYVIGRAGRAAGYNHQ